MTVPAPARPPLAARTSGGSSEGPSAGTAAARDRLMAREVRRLVSEQHRRRRIPVVVHLGTPGALRQTLTADPEWDHALRTDLLVGLLDARVLVPGLCELWLTRGGDHLILEDDLVWLRAAQLAAGVRGARLPGLTVVTRHGWRDLVTGAGRAWVRSRALRPDAKR